MPRCLPLQPHHFLQLFSTASVYKKILAHPTRNNTTVAADNFTGKRHSTDSSHRDIPSPERLQPFMPFSPDKPVHPGPLQLGPYGMQYFIDSLQKCIISIPSASAAGQIQLPSMEALLVDSGPCCCWDDRTLLVARAAAGPLFVHHYPTTFR